MGKGLDLITVYFDTIDYPNVYVARFFEDSTPTEKILGPAKTLEEIRALIPKWMVKIDRDINDDKNIVEIWV